MERTLPAFTMLGTGKALPEGRLDNAQLARELGTDPESVFKRTGINERRVAEHADSASSLGARAARAALEAAGVPAPELDLVLLSTYTPDHLLCPTAPALARAVGAEGAGAFDINGACSGGVSTLLTGVSLLGTGAFEKVLVVASDLTSKFLRPDDPKTRLVFGDGAAALLIGRPGLPGGSAWQPLSTIVGSDGSGADLFRVPAGGSAHPPQLNGTPQAACPGVVMDGRAVFRFGIERGCTMLDDLCERAGIGTDEIDWVVPHQANLRMIAAMQERCGLPPERWIVNIERYGNTASCSVPLAFAELVASGRVGPGERVALLAFGAGLTWSGMILEALEV